MSATQEAPSPAIAAAESGPYKFLDYFQEKDNLTFSGREKEIGEITARINVDRTVVLYGPSGLGKTSMILAGVFPELRRRGLLPVYCRVLQNPTEDVEQALRAELKLEAESDLSEECRRQRIVLVLDQFEEFFIRFDKNPEVRRAFPEMLAALLSDPKSHLRVLISLREDYLARLDELKELMPGMFTSEYRLRQLTAFGARQAITKPLNTAGIQYEPKLVSHILEIVSAEEYDSLLLQIICCAVVSYAAREGRPKKLFDSDLKAVGGLEGILGRYLDEATQDIAAELQLLTRTLLDALITSENTKRAVTLAALQEWDVEARASEIVRALEYLEEKRLVRREMRGSNVWYELTHERLVKPILRWFELDRTFADFRFAREVVINGARNERFRSRPETLLNKETIEQVVRPVRERLRLDAQQVEFMYWSSVYRRCEDVEFWARKVPVEQCRAILLDLMKRKDVAARVGAAACAVLIADDGSLLADECLRLAMEDESAEVRRAAGASLSKLGGEAQIQKLREGLRRKATRQFALEALADIDQTAPAYTQSGLSWRWRAGRIARRRIFDKHRSVLNQRTKVGALAGLISALVWGFTIFPVFLSAWLWNTGVIAAVPIMDAEAISNLGVAMSILFPSVIGAGVLIGVAVSRIAARAAVQGRAVSWFRGWLVTFLISLIAIALAVVFTLRSTNSQDWIIVPAVAVGIMLPSSICAVWLVRFGTSGMMDSGLWVAKRWGIGLLQATAPFSICGVVGVGVGMVPSPLVDMEFCLVLGIADAFLWSLIFYTWSMSLVESELRSSEDVHARLSLYGKRASRWSSVVFVGCVLAGYVLIFGIRSIPFFAEHAVVSSNGISLEVHRGGIPNVPHVVFFSVDVQESSPHFYRTVDTTTGAGISFHDVKYSEIAYLPTRKTLGLISPLKGSDNRGELKANVAPVQVITMVPLLHALDEWQYIVIEMKKTSVDPPTWTGAIARTQTGKGERVELQALMREPYAWSYSQPVGNLVASGNSLRTISPNLGSFTKLDLDTAPAAVVLGPSQVGLTANSFREGATRTLILEGGERVDLKLSFSTSDTNQKIGLSRERSVPSHAVPSELTEKQVSEFPATLKVVLGYRRPQAKNAQK